MLAGPHSLGTVGDVHRRGQHQLNQDSAILCIFNYSLMQQNRIYHLMVEWLLHGACLCVHWVA